MQPELMDINMPKLCGYSRLFVVYYMHSLLVVTLYLDFLLGIKPYCLKDSTHMLDLLSHMR